MTYSHFYCKDCGIRQAYWLAFLDFLMDIIHYLKESFFRLGGLIFEDGKTPKILLRLCCRFSCLYYIGNDLGFNLLLWHLF